MNTAEKIKRSWWVIFPFTIFLPGFGFIYIGLKSQNKNWVLEGITYQLPVFFYFAFSSIFSFNAMAPYYVWLILLAVLIALIRSLMVIMKLWEVYENEDTPRITQASVTSGSSSSEGDKQDNWKSCCICIVCIFIIFAIISIF